jgi:hypothetical protein
MGLNYYSTRVNVSPSQEPDILTQGLMVFLTSTPVTPIIAYMHVKYEFQTLEDPSFLARLVNGDKSEAKDTMIVPRPTGTGEKLWN